MNRYEINRIAYTLISIPVACYVLHELGLDPVRSNVDSAETIPSGCQVTLCPHFSQLHYRKKDQCTKDGATDGTWVKFSLQKEGESIPFKLRWWNSERADTDYDCAITAISDIDPASRYTYHLGSDGGMPTFWESCEGSCKGVISISCTDPSLGDSIEPTEMVQRQRGEAESETDAAAEVDIDDPEAEKEAGHDEL